MNKVFPSEQRKKVLWADESSFNLQPTSGYIYIQRKPKDTINPQSLLLTVMCAVYGGGSIMEQAAMCKSFSHMIAQQGCVIGKAYEHQLLYPHTVS